MSAAHDVLQLDTHERARMIVAALGPDFDPIVRYLLALFMENRDHVGGGTAPEARQEQFEGPGSGFSAPLDIYRLSMAAGRRRNEVFVSGVLDEGGRVGHVSTNNTRYTGPLMPESITLTDIQQARQRIASCVRRTPLSPTAALSERLKTNVYVKLELF